VNPNGLTTTYRVDYDLASSEWCSTSSSSGSPAHSTTEQPLGSIDTDYHDVSVDLTGLTARTDYCAELVVTNGSGSAEGGQVWFTAGAPSVLTSGSPMMTGATTATVDGSVNPAAQTTTYRVEYDLAGSEWCMSGGSSGSPAHLTTPQTLGFTDATFHDVSVDLTDLDAGEGYCAELIATNGSGSGGDSYQFSFTAGAPSANTNSATVTGATTATVDGDVNPAGQTTTYQVEYDLASSLWCTFPPASAANSTTPQTLGFTDATSHHVSVDLTGLTAGTRYCAGLVATNGSGSAEGDRVSFTAGLPSAATYAATPTGLTTAMIEGAVNPAGQTTTYEVKYGLASADWCTSGGSLGSPSSTTSQTLGSTDTTDHYVTVDLTGLTAGTRYCAGLVATNGSGSADGGRVSFTAGLPSADNPHGGGGPATGATTATIGGSVNPAGQTTTYKVEYDLASSGWCTSGGSSGSSAHSTTPQTLGFTDGTFHDVSVALTGLTAGTEYCTDLVATNGTGSADAGQDSFTAGTPGVAPYGATVTGATTATVDGMVNPAGQTTTYKAEYGLASSDWCDDSSGSPANSTTPQTLIFNDGTFHDVSVNLTGLTAGTDYCAVLVATNSAGSAVSGQVSFTAGAPSAFTNNATVTGATTATVDGSVNPAVQTTTYKVEYGLASSNWCASGGSSGSPASSTTPQALGSTDATSHDVAVDLTGLTAGTAYCADLVATNGSGSGDGGQVSFTTTAVHSLTVSLGGAGSGSVSGTGVSCPGTCSHSYPTGTIVTLTAAPAAGSIFAGWSGGGCSGTSSCQALVNSDVTVTATFNNVPPNLAVNLTVSKSGAGNGTVTSSPAGIACGSICLHAFSSGTSVTLTAAPAAGSTFAGWSGGGCSGSGSCALTANADTTVTATFNLIPISTPTSTPPQAKKAPQTRISKATINSKKRTATFKFVGSGSSKPYSFQCKLDKKKWASCRSGMTYKGLKPGSHTFWVRAKDDAGRVDKTPATKKFKI